MNALVIEGVMKIAEELLVGVSTIQRRVMFPRHEPHCFCFQLTDDVTEFSHAVSADVPIVGGLSEIACEHDKIRLLLKTVHGSHGLFQGPLRIRIDIRSVKTPVGIGQLDKIEGLALHLWSDAGANRGTGSEHSGAEARKLQKVTPSHGLSHC